ncbi:hypothetical protein [Deinococcus koreensis]|uniref:DUF1579 domain-containing protein n=1 Tax=Deinococcus koreensis TaxID=2054903 RepID=A0A2K3UVY3_9DEIO|nr:hypothetical protein [Deinococcus koreensis]PNY80680.1 hypothetical protein CVO96_04260 [Deinococcus koreensis]
MRIPLAALCLTLLFPAQTAQASSSRPSASQPSTSRPSPFQSFVGRWAGNLEYQDYGADRRVKIPVQLTITASGTDSARWLFSYDDFGTTVSSDETHRWATGTYTVKTAGQPTTQTFRSTTFAALARPGGQATLLGSELENGVKVEVRRTLRLGARTLVTLTETRQPGGDFRFRNQSSYTRK